MVDICMSNIIKGEIKGNKYRISKLRDVGVWCCSGEGVMYTADDESKAIKGWYKKVTKKKNHIFEQKDDS